jgi:hypothetical protein
MSTSGTDLSRQAGVVLTAFSFVTGQAPSLALDGATNTYYESRGSGTTASGEWLNLDLGTDVPLSSINYFEHVNIASSLRDDSIRCYMVFWKDSQGKTLQINLYKTVNATYQFKAGSPDYPPTAPSPGAHPHSELIVQSNLARGASRGSKAAGSQDGPGLSASPPSLHPVGWLAGWLAGWWLAGWLRVAKEEGGIELQVRLAATALQHCARCSKPVLANLRGPAC